MYAAQERHVFYFVVVFIHFLVVSKHTAYATLARIGSYTIVDTVVHRHGVRHLLRQAAFQMHMVVYHREVLLLETDDGIVLFVYPRHCVCFIDRVFFQTSHVEVTKSDITVPAF